MPADPFPDAHDRFDEVERLALGDHPRFLLERVAAELATPRTEFRFHRARRVEPGHRP
jgi:hypothetical protein